MEVHWTRLRGSRIEQHWLSTFLLPLQAIVLKTRAVAARRGRILSFSQSLAGMTYMAILAATLAIPQAASAGLNRWTPLGPNLSSNLDWSWTIGIDSKDSGTIYQQVADVRSYPTTGQVLKSTNATEGGGTFSSIKDDCYPVVYSGAVLTIDPKDSKTIYVICLYSLYRSRDGGNDWQPLLTYDSGGRGVIRSARVIEDFAIDPTDSRVLYATGVEQGSGAIFKSQDGGESWAISIVGPSSISKIAVAPNDARVLFAADWGGNILKSVDSGASWTISPKVSPYPWTFAVLEIDPRDPRFVIGCTGDLYSYSDYCVRSRDGGDTWQKLKLPVVRMGWDPSEQDVHSIVFDPLTPGMLYAGGGGGVSRSTDWGATWTLISDGLVEHIFSDREPYILVFSLALDPQNPNRLLAGTADGIFEITFPPSTEISSAGKE